MGEDIICFSCTIVENVITSQNEWQTIAKSVREVEKQSESEMASDNN